MTVIFKTNIDHYGQLHFPIDFTQVPRIGEKVAVRDKFTEYFTSRKLPAVLEVVDVTYTENHAVCELRYRKIDVEIAKNNGTELF